MHEQTDSDEQAIWDSLDLDPCPRCGQRRVVPTVPGWELDRYCLSCEQLVGGAGQTDELQG